MKLIGCAELKFSWNYYTRKKFVVSYVSFTKGSRAWEASFTKLYPLEIEESIGHLSIPRLTLIENLRLVADVLTNNHLILVNS